LLSHILPGQAIDIEVSPQEFFAYATLKLQDPRIKRRQTFRQTKKKWRNILEREGDYLTFTKSNLIAKLAAGSEDLTELSAVVGIGCELIALGHTFNVNIYRFKRFKPTNQAMQESPDAVIAVAASTVVQKAGSGASSYRSIWRKLSDDIFPSCHAKDGFRRSKVQWFDFPMLLLFLRPVRCLACYACYYRFRKVFQQKSSMRRYLACAIVVLHIRFDH